MRRAAERNTFPDHLPRERMVIDPPTACECCGGNRLRKLGEDVAALAAGDRIVFGAIGNVALVDLDKVFEERTIGIDHGAA